MSDILSIGASGVKSYQTALTTISENISNANTAGYARRTATLTEVAAPTSGLRTAATNGMGVMVSGIARSADDSRSAAVRSAGSDLARTQSAATWLDGIESALGDNKLSDQLTAFFNASKAVAADPTSTASRATMLEAASTLAASFTSTSNALAGVAGNLDDTAEAAVNQLNALSASLAQVNAGLGRVTSGTSSQAALLDQRDQLLEQMSALTDVGVTLDTAGRATVTAGAAGGPVLVQGDIAGTVTYVRNDEGAVSFAVHRAGTTSAMSPNGGALGGVVDGAQQIASATAQLNSLAQDFVDGVNAVQAGGEDLTGATGAAMFATGDPAARVSLVLDDPRGIAAAAPGGGTRDNSNLANLDTLRTSGGFESKLTDLVSTVGAKLSAKNSIADAQSAIRDNAVSERDAVSGVNIDEEAVDLMRFQQAYQASSRVIQIARETLQTLLDIR